MHKAHNLKQKRELYCQENTGPTFELSNPYILLTFWWGFKLFCNGTVSSRIIPSQLKVPSLFCHFLIIFPQSCPAMIPLMQRLSSRTCWAYESRRIKPRSSWKHLLHLYWVHQAKKRRVGPFAILERFIHSWSMLTWNPVWLTGKTRVSNPKSPCSLHVGVAIASKFCS